MISSATAGMKRTTCRRAKFASRRYASPSTPPSSCVTTVLATTVAMVCSSNGVMEEMVARQKPLRDKPGFPVRGAYELLDARNGADRAELGQCRLAAVRLGNIQKRCQQDVLAHCRGGLRRGAGAEAVRGDIAVYGHAGKCNNPRSTTSGESIFGFLNIFWHNDDVILSQEGSTDRDRQSFSFCIIAHFPE